MNIFDDYITCGRKDLTVPSITLPPNICNRILVLLKKYPSLEWLAFLRGEKTENTLKITEMLIPPQKVGRTTCETSAVPPSKKSATELIGNIHSHNSMGAFHSGTDKEFLHNFEFAITVNDKFEFASVCITSLPCGGMSLIDCDVILEGMELDYPIEKEEIKVYRTESYSGYTQPWQSDCPSFSEKEEEKVTVADIPESKNKYIKVPLPGGGYQLVPIKEYVKDTDHKFWKGGRYHKSGCNCKYCRKHIYK